MCLSENRLIRFSRKEKEGESGESMRERERERELHFERVLSAFICSIGERAKLKSACVCACLCAVVCLRERERESMRDRNRVVLLVRAAEDAPFQRGNVPRVKIKINYGSCLEIRAISF